MVSSMSEKTFESGKSGEYVVAHYSDEFKAEISTALSTGEVDGVSIAPDYGFSGLMLDFLSELPNLRILIVIRSPNIRAGTLPLLPHLEDISIDETRLTLDLRKLPALKKASLDWHKNIFLNAEKSKIESLHIWKYKSVTSDLTEMPLFPCLNEFELVQSSIKSLRGIDRFPHLKKLELHYLTRLETLTKLSLDELTTFIAFSCKKITDHENIATCPMIRELKMNKCGTMKSVKFVKQLPHLNTFRFLHTAIADGDYSPLHSLEDVYFTNNRVLGVKVSDFRQTPRSIRDANKQP